jgi:Putative adhesin
MTRTPFRPALAVLAGVAVVAVVAAIGLTVASVTFGDTEHRAHVLHGDVSRVVVHGDSGDVRVVPGAAGRVEVRETRRSWLGEPKLRLSLRGGVLDVSVDCPRLTPECSDDLAVAVPPAAAARGVFDLRTDSGDVSATGVGGPLTMQTDSGDVSGDRLAGATVSGTSDSGDVHLALVAAGRAVKASTGSGNVAVTVPPGRYRIGAQTDSGDVDLDRVQPDDRAVQRIDASSDSGDVAVRGR